MGLPMENDLLTTTSEQIKEPELKFDAQKNLLSLTSQSINKRQLRIYQNRK